MFLLFFYFFVLLNYLRPEEKLVHKYIFYIQMLLSHAAFNWLVLRERFLNKTRIFLSFRSLFLSIKISIYIVNFLQFVLYDFFV